MRYDAVIVGGGLAGCAAAIELAGTGARVLLLEAKRAPAHKLCGEFLSGEASGALARLGVWDQVLAAGAQPIRRVVMTASRGRSFACDLPSPGLGLSRRRLDPLLWARAEQSGAECRAGACVRRVEGDLAGGFYVTTDGQSFSARMVIEACGRRPRAWVRASARRRSPYVAFKAHFAGAAPLDGAIEMHAFPGGYCGLSTIEGGQINVCWIAHQRALAASGGHVQSMLSSALAANPALARRIEPLTPVTKFIGVSQIAIGSQGAFDGDICRVGDAAGMIAPLCGDGMAMALRSAQIAARRASPFLAGSQSAEEFRGSYSQAWKREFGLRLSLGRVAHAGALSPALSQAWLAGLNLAPAFGRWMIVKTRG